ncbi:23273_t:CDS:2 [Dentiscutata erythropus]|uniref:23273_t:CDS:1 n=1 Tax=Dentiscutata erythropus TaxID=1348616 RepID=A0A9N9B3H0_9GLOM|nr:23273_t:CDS:2 [Dentiscutata erythropus]
MVGDTIMKMKSKVELPIIKNTNAAAHPNAVFTSRPLSSLIKTALALQNVQLNCLPVTGEAHYITRENLFDIVNESIAPDLESFNKIDQRLDYDQVFYSYHDDNLNSEKVLNNKCQSFYNFYENMKNKDNSSKSNKHPKMNLTTLLNDQDSNDQDFYFCQRDNLNFENIYHNDNISLTKNDQYSTMDSIPFQYSTTDLMPFQYSTTDLMPF